MKNGLVITVAGMSTRFNQGQSKAWLKCLYHRGDHKDSLLGRLLDYSSHFSKVFIVGGYKFDDLKDYIAQHHGSKNIELVFNPRFDTFGSMESLWLGVEAAEKSGIDRLVFAEGDLFFDKKTFLDVVDYGGDVLTTNSEPITAKKAVALYITTDNQVKYVYDSLHKSLLVDVPFSAIYNSGQIWKFADAGTLYAANKGLTIEERAGNNLVLIQKYYQNRETQPRIVQFEKWFNCNTPADYDLALQELT